jgi:hypothetical protein
MAKDINLRACLGEFLNKTIMVLDSFFASYRGMNMPNPPHVTVPLNRAGAGLWLTNYFSNQ